MVLVPRSHEDDIFFKIFFMPANTWHNWNTNFSHSKHKYIYGSLFHVMPPQQCHVFNQRSHLTWRVSQVFVHCVVEHFKIHLVVFIDGLQLCLWNGRFLQIWLKCKGTVSDATKYLLPFSHFLQILLTFDNWLISCFLNALLELRCRQSRTLESWYFFSDNLKNTKNKTIQKGRYVLLID